MQRPPCLFATIWSLWVLSFGLVPSLQSEGLTLMPLGDSITFGFDGSNAGYRGGLYALLSAQVTGLRFVGTSTEGVVTTSTNPLPVSQRGNEGHGSYTISDLSRNLDGFDDTLFRLYGGENRDPHGGHWLSGVGGRAALYPDIITLMIGTNDLCSGPTAPPYESGAVRSRLHALLEKISSLRPRTKIFLAQIIPCSVREHADDFNRIVAAEVSWFQGRRKMVYLVDLNTEFPKDGLSADGIHPNDTGFSWIALKWYEAISAVYCASLTPQKRADFQR